MPGSPVLDVAIGMVFIYLLLSLVVTATNELIASWLQARGKFLRMGIEQLLTADWAREVYQHPLIGGLSRSPKSPEARALPSYIPSRTFALAVLETIVGDSDPAALAGIREKIAALPPQLKKPLTTLYHEAKGDIDAFKVNVEVWFNNAMDRVGGWYKKKTQYVVLGIGAVVAVSLNADSLSLIDHLSRSSAVRSALVEQAGAAVKQPPPANVGSTASPQANFDNAMTKLENLKLPIGWSEAAVNRYVDNGGWGAGYFLSSLLGWCLTALAASLGAPFWFDLLNKFMNIRAAGKAPEEQPKAPKEIPQPASPGEIPGAAGVPPPAP